MTLATVEFLQIRAYSDHPEVVAAARLLLEIYYKESIRRKNEDSMFRDAKKVIASLWAHPSDLFRFTTKTTYFTEGNRKQVWMTNGVLKLFNLMREIGWVNDAVQAIPPFASSKSDGTGVAAIYARSSTFKTLLKNLTTTDLDINCDLSRIKITIELEDVPQLKAEKILFIDQEKRLNNYTDWTISTLQNQWDLLKKFKFIKADRSPVHWSDIFYHQSLRGRMLRGGRLYAPFCMYPKKERLGITIDGEAVGSLDLSQIHPTFLLAQSGHQREVEVMERDAPEDAYSMPEFNSLTRQHNKVLINILFNATSIDSATRAFINTHHWHDPITNELEIKTYKGKTRKQRKGEPIFEPNTKIQALKYIESFKNYHPAFANLIATKRAIDLQSLDAHIALLIIEIMTSAGLPVLTVHDEFIVRQQDRQRLETVLFHATKHVLSELYGDEWKTVKAKWETLQCKETIYLNEQ